MKKVFKLSGLDCPSCAAKLERAARKIPGVEGVSSNIITQKLTVEVAAGASESVFEQVRTALLDAEPGMEIV